MPEGMLLRSPLAGTHISDPLHALRLDAFQRTSGTKVSAPLPLDRFRERSPVRQLAQNSPVAR